MCCSLNYLFLVTEAILACLFDLHPPFLQVWNLSGQPVSDNESQICSQSIQLHFSTWWRCTSHPDSSQAWRYCLAIESISAKWYVSSKCRSFKTVKICHLSFKVPKMLLCWVQLSHSWLRPTECPAGTPRWIGSKARWWYLGSFVTWASYKLICLPLAQSAVLLRPHPCGLIRISKFFSCSCMCCSATLNALWFSMCIMRSWP